MSRAGWVLSEGRKVPGFAYPNSMRPGPDSREESDHHQRPLNTFSSLAWRMAEVTLCRGGRGSISARHSPAVH